MRCRTSGLRWVQVAALVAACACPALGQARDPFGGLERVSPPVRAGLAATVVPMLIGSGFAEPAPEVALGLVAGGFVLGPVAGYAYARDLGGAFPGLGWRVGFAAASSLLLSAAGGDEPGDFVAVLFALMPVTVGAVALLWLDFRRLEQRTEADRRFRLAPVVLPGGVGVSARLRW